jgi:nitric oxide dioxygenase
METVMLTAPEIALVRLSFARALPSRDMVADLFYDRLFEVAPTVRALFPPDLREQKRKLMTMIATAVGTLNDLQGLVPAIKELGARHVTYGATAAHYEVVGQVLLWTLERVLRDDFTPDIRAAWTKVYGILAATMLAGAAEAAELQAAE